MKNKKREEKIRKILKEINENYKQFLKPGSYTGKPLPYKQPDKGDGVQLGATDGTTLDYFICSAPGNFPGGGDTGLGLSFFDNFSSPLSIIKCGAGIKRYLIFDIFFKYTL